MYGNCLENIRSSVISGYKSGRGNVQEVLINGQQTVCLYAAAGFPYAGVIRVRFSGYDLSLLLQAPPTVGSLLCAAKITACLLICNLLVPGYWLFELPGWGLWQEF